MLMLIMSMLIMLDYAQYHEMLKMNAKNETNIRSEPAMCKIKSKTITHWATNDYAEE